MSSAQKWYLYGRKKVGSAADRSMDSRCALMMMQKVKKESEGVQGPRR
jgi:hypothetical protein